MDQPINDQQPNEPINDQQPNVPITIIDSRTGQSFQLPYMFDHRFSLQENLRSMINRLAKRRLALITCLDIIEHKYTHKEQPEYLFHPDDISRYYQDIDNNNLSIRQLVLSICRLTRNIDDLHQHIDIVNQCIRRYAALNCQ